MTLTTSVQRCRRFGTSYSINNYTSTLQPVIEALRMRQKIIFKLCGKIGHKFDACIIRGPKSLSPSLRININQFKFLHGEEPTEPPRYCNSQPPAAHLKSSTSPPKTSPVVSAIMGRLNLHAIDNGGVQVHPSEFPVESNSESILDSDTNPIK